jgi:hypothetical protein
MQLFLNVAVRTGWYSNSLEDGIAVDYSGYASFFRRRAAGLRKVQSLEVLPPI